MEPGAAVHDFDFYMGTWWVRHRRLKERLAGSDEWEEFEGTSRAWPLLDGAGNVDDNVLEMPNGTYLADLAPDLRTLVPDPLVDLVARRSRSRWLLDPPVVSRLRAASAPSSAPDTFKGRPSWSAFCGRTSPATTCRWEQAFSVDDGATWEVNWMMESTRIE